MKFKIKKGDNVIVIAGKDKGVTGKVEKMLIEERKALVSGVNMVSKHVKGKGMVKKNLPIHISNIMHFDPETGKPSRCKMVINPETKEKQRVLVKTNKVIG